MGAEEDFEHSEKIAKAVTVGKFKKKKDIVWWEKESNFRQVSFHFQQEDKIQWTM